MTIEERYLNIVKIITEGNDSRKEDFIRLFTHMEQDTDWAKSPASTRYHNSFEGGLVEHSVNVAELCIKFKKILAPEISIESAAFVGIAHDFGKVGNYIIKEPTEKQIAYGYPGSITFNTDLPYMEHEHRSLKVISEYVKLTDDEWTAICYHNAPWNGDMTTRFRQCKLMTILQQADYFSCLYMEKGGSK